MLIFNLIGLLGLCIIEELRMVLVAVMITMMIQSLIYLLTIEWMRILEPGAERKDRSYLAPKVAIKYFTVETVLLAFVLLNYQLYVLPLHQKALALATLTLFMVLNFVQLLALRHALQWLKSLVVIAPFCPYLNHLQPRYMHLPNLLATKSYQHSRKNLDPGQSEVTSIVEEEQSADYQDNHRINLDDAHPHSVKVPMVDKEV